MQPSDYYLEIVEVGDLPPGASRVYCAFPKGGPRGRFHTDALCPKLAQSWRLAAYTLADAVNFNLGVACGYCVPDVDVLRAVVREHDDYGRPITVQAGLEGVG